MLIRLLPLIAGLAPFIAINLAMWIGMTWGPLPSCFPYVDGCMSISATGRHPPGSYLFRAVQMPQSILLVLVWYYAGAWLAQLDPPARRATSRWILAWGVAGALALIIYVTFLGTREPLYEFMRRFGIYLYFLGTVVAQILVTLQLRVVRASVPSLARTTALMSWLVVLPFVLGILNLILKNVLEDADMWENRIEWIVSTMMQAWFVALHFAWRTTGLTATVSVGPTSAR